MQQRFLALILALMSSAGYAGGLPKHSAQAGQVGFTATLLRDTVRVGEPLLVTCVLKNPTIDTQYIPFDTPGNMSDLGMAQYTLLDAEGRTYWPEIWKAVDGTWMSSSCAPVAPGDSVYWHQLLSLDHYYVAATGPHRWFEQVPGSYRLVIALQLPKFVVGDAFPKGPLSLADTLAFSLVLDSVLTSRIQPYRKVLSDGLWTLFIPIPPQEMDSILRSLAPRPAAFDATYPYLDYLLPHALSAVKRSASGAIEEGRHFIETYPCHPLSEEMTFDMWYFFGRLGRSASQDSLARVLLKTYPRNTRVKPMQRWLEARGQ
jgi:hypothetical protein